MVESSDSEDDEQIRRFIEATDTTLLSETLYQLKKTEKVKQEHVDDCAQVPVQEVPLLLVSRIDPLKSQRYLPQDGDNADTDLNLPETLQRHIYKKFSDVLHAQIEFCDLPVGGQERRKCAKSKVKLLCESECYVKPYEEFEYETKGPEKKPTIKRRKIVEEGDGVDNQSEIERLRSAAVSVSDLMAGIQWAQKPDRKDRVFHYKMASNGTIHAKEVETEFTRLRRKNKWTVAKIRMKIKPEK